MHKVLIVDDEPRVIKSLKKLIPFKELGLELVYETTDSIDALDFLQNNQVDILITDIKMPKLDGLTLLEMVFKLSNHPLAIITTAFDQFDYVKKAISLGVENYLLKPINKKELRQTLITTIEKCNKKEIAKILNNNYSQFYQNLIKRWLENAIEYPELRERAQYAKIFLDHDNFLVVHIYHKMKKIDLQEFKEKANQIFFEFLSKNNHINYVSFDNHITIIFSFDNLKYYTKHIKSNLYGISKYISNYLKTNVFIVIGQYVTSYRDLHISHQSAKSTSGMKRFLPSETILDTNMEFKENSIFFESINFFELDNAIKTHNPKKAIEFINSLYIKLNEDMSLNESIYTKVSIELLMHITMIHRNQNNKTLPLPTILENLFDTYNKILWHDDLLMLFSKSIIKTNDYLKKIDNNNSPVISYIVHYLETNYFKTNLSLKEVAKMVSINSSYLGQLFKKEMHISFSRFLNNIRISRAKILLETTNKTIHIIANECGYSNQSYFQKIFKKHTLQSPLDYRKNHPIRND